MPHVFAFATKGSGTNEERRLRRLLDGHPTTFLPFDRRAKARSAAAILRTVLSDRPDLLVMEGTGIAGGIVCLLARAVAAQPYVVSSGDAVGPLVGGIVPPLGPAFALYERLLCRLSSGFIGWTPYLAGRALTFGSPRAMTAAGWAECPPAADARQRIRRELGIPADAVVFGLVGSLVWNRRHRYSYGSELVRAAAAVDRPDLRVLVIGDGSGLNHLRTLAGDSLGRTVLLPGPVPADRVTDYMAAMDVGSLPQSVDRVGAFRYTTKLSEYLTARLPVVTGQIPLAYDLDDGWLWRLPGDAPWDDRYVAALAGLMATVTPADLVARRDAIAGACPTVFDPARQVRTATAFIADVLARLAPRTGAATRRPAPAVGPPTNPPPTGATCSPPP